VQEKKQKKYSVFYFIKKFELPTKVKATDKIEIKIKQSMLTVGTVYLKLGWSNNNTQKKEEISFAKE
jgi:hypothetical protein